MIISLSINIEMTSTKYIHVRRKEGRKEETGMSEG